MTSDQSKVIPRALGVTPQERHLNRLGEASFLRLWSYAGVFRDQGQVGRGGEGQEVCDLLLVFSDDVVLFSDKASTYPETGNEDTDWRRWYGKTIRHAVRQLNGAARWVRQHPDRLFIDRPCKFRLPVPIPDSSRLRLHRVVVAHGCSSRCKARLGGSGSLMIRPGIGEAIRPTRADRGQEPFTIGSPVEADGFVHVLDDTTLPALLRTLSTVSDFVAYLRRKEAFILGGRLGIAAGEEELLGLYLANVNSDDDHDFVVPAGSQLVLPEGHWERFHRSPERAAQLEADQISYLWDDLIEKLSDTLLSDTAYRPTVSGVTDTEPLLRILARENRTQRRFLAESLFEVARRADTQVRAARIYYLRERPTLGYVFVALDPSIGANADEYRDRRRTLMHAYSLVARRKFPEFVEIVAIGTEPAKETLRSYDAAFVDVHDWTVDQAEQARRLEEEFDIMKRMARGESIGEEYPVERQRATGVPGRLRNKPCHCGSGRKYKKCHGRP